MIYQETADLAADLPSFVEMCARLPDIKADASFGGCLGLASWGVAAFARRLGGAGRSF